MDAERLLGRDDTPTVEVRVLRDGELIHRELCESAEEASSVVAQWAEMEGVRCEVDDLSAHHHAGEILEPEPDNSPGDGDEGHEHLTVPDAGVDRSG
jgi:hypothetical protein